MNLNATVIGQMIAFGVFVWFCMTMVWPRFAVVLAERQKKIADGLGAAEKAQRDLVLAQEQVANELKQVKAQAVELLEQASKRASQMVEDAKEAARAEAERIRVQAQNDIEQEVHRAREKLRADVATLAVAGAEKILAARVDAAAHGQMLEQLAAQL